MTLDENIQKYFANAKKYSEKGNVLGMDYELSDANDYAVKVGLDISEEVAKIEQAGYVKALSKYLNVARKCAEEGNLNAMYHNCSYVKECADAIGQDISDEVAKIEQSSYANVPRFNLNKAKKYAEEGDLKNTEWCLSLANEYAVNVGEDISENVAKIEQIGHANAVSGNLKNAREYAKLGDMERTNEYLSLANEYAGIGREYISDEVAKIEQLSYGNGLIDKLKDAKKYAEEGDIDKTKMHLLFAKDYAVKAAEDISEQVTKIEQTGYANAPIFSLNNAKESAENGSVDTTERHLSLAKDYAVNVGQDISDEVAKIEQIGYRNAVQLELEDARECAENGYMDATERHLLLAKDYAVKAAEDISEQVTKIEQTGYANIAPSNLKMRFKRMLHK